MSGPSVAIKGGEYTLFILNSEVEDAIPRSPGCWTFKFWPRQQNLWVSSGSGSAPRL